MNFVYEEIAINLKFEGRKLILTSIILYIIVECNVHAGWISIQVNQVYVIVFS